MKSSCLPNYEQKIVRISALQYTGQKSWQFIVHTFGKNDDFTNSFWSLLTFSTKTFLWKTLSTLCRVHFLTLSNRKKVTTIQLLCSLNCEASLATRYVFQLKYNKGYGVLYWGNYNELELEWVIRCVLALERLREFFQ